MTNVFPHNPLILAEKAQQMAQKSGGHNSEMFQKIAMISMCMIAVTGAMHLLNQVYRDLHSDDRGRCR